MWVVSLNTTFTSEDFMEQIRAPLRLVPETNRNIQPIGDRIIGFGTYDNFNEFDLEDREVSLRNYSDFMANK